MRPGGLKSCIRTSPAGASNAEPQALYPTIICIACGILISSFHPKLFDLRNYLHGLTLRKKISMLGPQSIVDSSSMTTALYAFTHV